MALLRWENKPKQQFSAVHYNYEFLTGKNILPEDIRGFFFPLSSIKTEPYVSPHPKGLFPIFPIEFTGIFYFKSWPSPFSFGRLQTFSI